MQLMLQYSVGVDSTVVSSESCNVELSFPSKSRVGSLLGEAKRHRLAPSKSLCASIPTHHNCHETLFRQIAIISYLHASLLCPIQIFKNLYRSEVKVCYVSCNLRAGSAVCGIKFVPSVHVRKSMCVSRKLSKEGGMDVVCNHPRVGDDGGVLGQKHANRTIDVRGHEEPDRLWCMCCTSERKVSFTPHHRQLHPTELSR
jgi:hypothetical protein